MQISFHKLAQTSFKLKILRYLSIHGFNVTPFAANLLPRQRQILWSRWVGDNTDLPSNSKILKILKETVLSHTFLEEHSVNILMIPKLIDFTFVFL